MENSSEKAEKIIEYPYMPKGKSFEYVPADNKYMQAAKKAAMEDSLDKGHKTGSAIVIDGKLISAGANGSSYHEEKGCERKRQNTATGENYELCEGCHPKNHSEQKAIAEAIKANINLENSEIYLWGHFWCCKSCWDAMIDAGIAKVHLQENSEIDFNRNNPLNIIGKY